jgi:hypothetical protein
LNDEIGTNAALRTNWNTVRQWDDEKRYWIVDEVDAISLYTATTDAGFGVLEWVRRRW